MKAAGPLAGTTNATISQMISAATIQRVPPVDRDVCKLVQLSPGITPVNGAVNNVEFNERPGADVSGFSINGLPQGTLYYPEDGAPLTIAENNLGAMIPAEIPPLGSIQEYQIETNNVPASTQSFGTGVLSLVSKSGTNKVHGDGFFYGRPNFWAANDPFVKASQLEAHEPNKPPNFHRYQWAGSVGGPIRHDKVFYFADYELAAFNQCHQFSSVGYSECLLESGQLGELRPSDLRRKPAAAVPIRVEIHLLRGRRART